MVTITLPKTLAWIAAAVMILDSLHNLGEFASRMGWLSIIRVVFL